MLFFAMSRVARRDIGYKAQNKMPLEDSGGTFATIVIARGVSDEAIQSSLVALDCFAEPVIGRAFARPVGSQ